MEELTGIYKKMYESWHKPIVIRNKQELTEFTFGLLTSKGYMANLDSRGEGPDSKDTMGSQVYYDAFDFALWLQKRNSVENKLIASNAEEVRIFDRQPLSKIPKKYTFITDSNGKILRSATL
jgi:hypothetical protein